MYNMMCVLYLFNSKPLFLPVVQNVCQVNGETIINIDINTS